ncbi:MAG: MFS transporter [Acidimicrobiia bacterium]|nr:MFS transporter [Acidimicrobiia bacterium]
MAPPDPLLTRSFSVAFVANLLHGLSFFLFIHLPSYLTDLGADEAEVGLLIGVTAVSAIVVRPTLGKLMDTRGRMPVILAGGLVSIGATLLYLTVSSIGPWLYVVRIIHGFAMGSVFPSLFTYGADVVPLSRRTEGFALFGVSGLLPIALGGVIGDIVLASSTFDTLFIAAAGFALAGFLASTVLREEAELIGPGERHGGFIRQVWRPALFPVWMVTAAFAIALTGYFTFLRTFVDETGIGSVGLFFSFYAGTAIALRLTLAWLPQRVGQRRVLFPAFAALIAGFLVIARAGAGIDIALAGMLCGGGHAYAFPILMDYTVTRASTTGRGSAVSFFTALFDIGVLIGGPALGLIIELSGYTAMYVSAAVFLAAAVVLFGFWDRRYGAAPQVVPSASRPSV